MEKRELICIQCPMGCPLTVTVSDDGAVSVTGNTCPRGAAYGEKEVTHPTRTVTSTVKLDGGTIARVSVKTASDIPKEKIFGVMEEIRAARVAAPRQPMRVPVPRHQQRLERREARHPHGRRAAQHR